MKCFLRLFFLLLLLEGCSIEIKPYETYYPIQSHLRLSGIYISKVEIASLIEDVDSFSCRFFSIELPANMKLTNYLEKAILKEFENAGRIDQSAKRILQGYLLSATLDSSEASWEFSMRIKKSNGETKIVKSKYQFDSYSINSKLACQLARTNFLPAINNFIAEILRSFS